MICGDRSVYANTVTYYHTSNDVHYVKMRHQLKQLGDNSEFANFQTISYPAAFPLNTVQIH